MTRMAWVAAASTLIITSACMAHHVADAHSPASPGTASVTSPGTPSGMSADVCPMAVPGVQLSAADTQDGEAVTFTTSADRMADLRARVHAMADMHNRHHQAGEGGMHHGNHGDAMGGGSTGSGGDSHAMMMPPPSRAAVEDVAGGARLVVTPNDPADLEPLRAAVRTHAEHMRQTGTCGMGEHGKM